jgi:hypothetical protein
MVINTEEKAKIAVLCIIGTLLVCDEHFVMAGGCFAVLLPWSILGRVTSWLAEPVVKWRVRRAKRAPEPIEAIVQY